MRCKVPRCVDTQVLLGHVRLRQYLREHLCGASRALVFIAKPFDMSELCEMLLRWLRAKAHS